MRRALFLLSLLAALVVTTPPASAQVVYIQGGAGFPSSTGLNDAYKAGWNAGLGIGLPITSTVEGVVRGSIDRFENDLVGVDNFVSWSATGNLKLNGPQMNNRVMPYALAGAGLYRLGVQDAFESEFGLQFGAGLGIRTTPRANLLIEPNYVLVLNEGDNTQYFPVRFGVGISL
jgi:hypothetical protein